MPSGRMMCSRVKVLMPSGASAAAMTSTPKLAYLK